jgi:hypothetical protein
MIVAALLMLFAGPGTMFVVQAGGGTSYDVALSREALRSYVDDVGLFKRNMPGVVAVTPVGPDTYLYQTEKDLPLAGTMKTDFVIRKRTVGDSLTVYESVDSADVNYMYCQVLIRAANADTTTIAISLRLKLSRESGGDVHWLAPLLGEGFISREMSKDIEGMLETFVQNSNQELYARLRPGTDRRDG